MTIAMHMLINIFPLHTQMQNYHLKFPICYAKYHDVGCSLAKVTFVGGWYHIGN